jgi:hypothetical protein
MAGPLGLEIVIRYRGIGINPPLVFNGHTRTDPGNRAEWPFDPSQV